MLQPAGYIRALAEGLRAAGVRNAETSPVLRLARQGAGWQLVTPHGRIAAGKVILANNGQIESFGFGFGHGRLMHLFLYASMTADLGPEALRTLGGALRWGITPSDPMGTTMRRIDGPQGGNRIVTRTCATFEPGMEASEAALRRTAAVHRRKFAERFPALGSVRMEFSWAGHLCLSRNGVALMRELEPGLFAACVQNGLGTTRGTLTGIGAAELASGIESAITRHFTAEADPTPLPLEPLASFGASAYLRWKAWRASAE
ncbi:NAD(P)/FAD-dependent oxidoreductase [Cereibacter sphaeroides]|uniref:NAD(P)/FAD-dependent oxidoreductase n=1 Tax=Cereibacter sphaeroides TaxID=1063 RepID=UPI00031F20EB|nr:FAD-binding oxidoreductase [Cereibacter sphaeroides]